MNQSQAKLVRARWVLPVTAPPVRDGAVLVVGKCIAGVDTYKSLVLIAPPRVERLEFPESMVLPGLVNPHTHLENTHFAQVIRRPQPFGRWLRQMVRLVRKQTFDAAIAAAREGAQQLLRYGVTTVGEFSRWGASFVALQEAGIRGVVFKEFICLSDEEEPTGSAKLWEWLQAVRSQGSPLLKVGVGPHAPYTVTPSAFRQVVQLADELGLPLCTHAAESPAERALVERRKGLWRLWLGAVLRDAPLGLSPLRYLDWLGVLREGTLLVHCVQVDDEDITLLSQRPVWVVHCPRSNANLQVGTMPLAKMLSAGVKVCLATDGLASVDSLSPLDELRFVQRLFASQGAFAFSLSPAQWLRMVTINAAEALGMARETGSLEEGKRADIAVFPVNATEEPEEALIASACEAILTMVDGHIAWRAE